VSRYQVMVEVSLLLQSKKIDSFIIGATARDLLAKHYGITPSERKTEDVDFAVLLQNWNVLEELRAFLLLNKSISPSSDPNNKIRYYFKGTPFDLVPFGGVANQHVVSWPPHHDTAMLVLGYNEAMENALEIMIGGHKVKTLSLEFFVGLKLLAWGYNGARDRDIKDVGYILKNYENFNPGAYEYLLDQHLDLLDPIDSDPALAAIVTLGIFLGSKIPTEGKNRILQTLEKQKSKIISELTYDIFIDEDSRKNTIDVIDGQINALALGLRSAP